MVLRAISWYKRFMVYVRFYSDRFGNRIELTPERWAHVLSRHPELSAWQHLLGEALEAPEVVTRSIYDSHVRLYYRYFSHVLGGKRLVVVVQLNRRNLILTAYVTTRRVGGTRLWPAD